MATTRYDLTVKAPDLLGAAFDPTLAPVVFFLDTNLDLGEALTDVPAGEIRLGTARLKADSTGTAIFTNVIGSDSDPADLNLAPGSVVQYRVRAEYYDAVTRRKAGSLWTSGWFELTSDANLVDIATVEYAPVSWQTQFIEQAQEYLNAQIALSGINTTDSAVAGLISSGLLGPLTRAALTASTAEQVETPGSPVRTAVVATVGPASLAARAFRASLDAGLTTALAVIGDSTGNDDNEWARLLLAEIAAAHPEYTVQHATWNPTSEDADYPVVIQTGTAGLQYLDTTTHAVNLSLTQAESPHTVGVLDVRVKARLTSWTAPAASAVLAARNGDAPNRSWWFYVNAGNGKLAVSYSTDGTTLVTKASSVSLSTAANTIQWVRLVYTPSTDVKFYTSADGVTWTQLGSTVANTDGALYNANVPYEIGGRGFATSGASHIFAVDIRDGLNGIPLVPRLPALWGSSQRIHASVLGAPTLTLVNGSSAGSDLAYWTTTRIAKALPKFGQSLGFLSLSHNELNWYGPGFAPRYAAKATDVKAALGAGVPLIYLTQNPQVSPRSAELIATQAFRRVDILNEAVKAGAVSIDTFAEFLRVGTATTIQADGIHPTSAGSQLWRDTVRNAIGL